MFSIFQTNNLVSRKWFLLGNKLSINLISIIKLKKNQSVKANFKLTMQATFNEGLYWYSRWNLSYTLKLISNSSHLTSRHNDVVTMLLRQSYLTSLQRLHIVAMETLDNVAKTTFLQRLFRRRHDETTLSSDVSIATIWQLQSDVG